MADEEQLAILKQGVTAWNEWRSKNPATRPQLSKANLRKANLNGVNLSRANLSAADLVIANLRGTDLSWVDLGGADLSGADLTQADLTEAKLNTARLFGVELCEANLRGADLSKVTLSGADLTAADLTEANLSTATLFRATLRGANLSGARLSRAKLGGADLREATLFKANLNRANLNAADLSAADLREANLSGAYLRRMNINNTKVGWTTFANVDLRGIRGLATVKHEGPSSIGIDTLYVSQGQIPEIFLRGAGVPDNFIAYIGSLVGKAIEFYSCFISYSTKDQDFADRLYADLRAKHVRCWFAPHDVQAGRKLHEQIDEAIRVFDKLLLILSPASINSEWVRTEIAKARKRELGEKRRMLFPLRLVDFDTLRDWECFDADTGKDSARELREYFIPDFSHWKDHDAYSAAFERLLRDLKASDTALPASAP
jgi:uncharacterized protein YjbI with pentapeptide repeats